MIRVLITTTIMAVAMTLGNVANDAAALDLDITNFKATPRVRLARNPVIQVSLTVENQGDISGATAVATLVGIQNFKPLYSASIDVYDEPGHGRTAFDFPPIVATQAGDIVWTVEVHDDDADVDQATDVTEVIWRVRQPGNNIVPGDFQTKTLTGVDLTGIDLRGVDLSGADLAYAIGLTETISDATTVYDDMTDFTGTGFDPVAAGWTLATSSEPVEAVSMGAMKSRYADQ